MTSFTQEDVVRVAKGLTEAQREAMLNPEWVHPGGQAPICLVQFTDPWTAPVAEFFTMHRDRLTPLGLAVRNHLKETSK